MAQINPYFEIEATILSSNKTFTFTNIHQFTVIKAPFNKLANIITITIEADFESITVISKDVQTKQEPSCTLKIYNLKEKEGDGGKYNRGDKIFDGSYIIFHSIDTEKEEEHKEQQIQSYTKIMTFILINPILYWLNTNHEYITLVDNSTAYDALVSYESYLKLKFKDTFEFNHATKDINKYTYEQLLIRSPSDIMIPSRLLDDYKVLNSLGYYYYDDFNFTSNVNGLDLNSSSAGSKRSITNILMSIGKRYLLPKIDMFDELHNDSLYRIHLDGVESVSNTSDEFQKNAATIFVQNPNQSSNISIPTAVDDTRPFIGSTKKLESKLVAPKAGGSGRAIYGAQSQVHSENITPKHHISLYGPDSTPDSAGDAGRRFLTTRELLSTDIKMYVTLTIQECNPDILNLTSLYNLDETARTSFTYLPIILAQTFHKQKSQDSRLVHSVKAKFINFSS